MSTAYLTQEGYEKLQEELDYLRTVRRQDVAERLRAALVTRYAPRTCLVDDVTSAIGVHVGPGAWGIFYQVED